MFLRCNRRRKDGKEHYYWNIVENKRVSGGRVVQRQVLYLGEINDSQHEAWRKSIEIFEEGRERPEQVALFPEDRAPPVGDESIVRIRLKDLRIEKPRQWGGCWLGCVLYEQLGLGEFWRERLRPSRQGTRWAHVLQTLVVYRLMAPGSEWRLHREWYERSAMGDLMGEDFGIAEKNTLYRCHDRLLRHKKALFRHLTERWSDLFNARYEILLYDLTSTYFECDPNQEPAASSRLRKFGYSRDKRPDCVQVVIALVVTCEGLPTEEVLQQMRQSEPRIHYLVGTPRSWLGRFEQSLLQKDWKQLRPGIEVKLLSEGGETYVLAKSDDRVRKEKNMRLRRLRRLIEALKKLRESKRRYQRDTILIKLGEAKKEAGPRIFGLLDIEIAPQGAPPTEKSRPLSFRLNLKKIPPKPIAAKAAIGLRSTLSAENPEQLWRLYLQLTEIEQVFKENQETTFPSAPSIIREMIASRRTSLSASLLTPLWVTLKRRLYPMAPGTDPSRGALQNGGPSKCSM